MSHLSDNSIRRLTTRDMLKAKRKGVPLVMLTAYDALLARLLDPHCDMLLVGDSLGMVRLGMETTLPVTPEIMVMHGAAVMRGSQRAMVVLDMPFGSYQQSPQQAFENAAKMLQASGAQAVKLEGGEEMAETIRFLTQRGVAVMGHVGLTPQHVNQMGGFRVQGKNDASYAQVLKDAKAVQEAGAFAFVIEGVVEELALKVTQAVDTPTIGIGASAACDGQVLVSEDMLGFTDNPPKFVRQFATLGKTVAQAAEDYAKQVRARSFPADEECY
jgi:3-methyl-2-oxobutanoate hydroxymethyltransferase